jgi:hypothetical protein
VHQVLGVLINDCDSHVRRLAKQKQGLYAQWLQSGGNSLAGPYASVSYQDDLAWCEAVLTSSVCCMIARSASSTLIRIGLAADTAALTLAFRKGRSTGSRPFVDVRTCCGHAAGLPYGCTA